LSSQCQALRNDNYRLVAECNVLTSSNTELTSEKHRIEKLADRRAKRAAALRQQLRQLEAEQAPPDSTEEEQEEEAEQNVGRSRSSTRGRAKSKKSASARSDKGDTEAKGSFWRSVVPALGLAAAGGGAYWGLKKVAASSGSQKVLTGSRGQQKALSEGSQQDLYRLFGSNGTADPFTPSVKR
jgi:hypothetical protein